jgi:hypothetical protein
MLPSIDILISTTQGAGRQITKHGSDTPLRSTELLGLAESYRPSVSSKRASLSRMSRIFIHEKRGVSMFCTAYISSRSSGGSNPHSDRDLQDISSVTGWFDKSAEIRLISLELNAIQVLDAICTQLVALADITY